MTETEAVAAGDLELLAEALSAESAAVTQAERAGGAADFARAFVSRRYALGAEDRVDLETGVITRTEKTDE